MASGPASELTPASAPGRPWLGPAALALGVVALHLACGGRYGFFRDELYFVACGERLAWGYVDQPPLIAVVARLAWWLSGEGGSVLLFRLPAMLAQAGSVLLAAALARRLGGGALAMTLAGAAVATAPVQLAQGHLLTMNVLEILLWSGVALAALQATAGRRSAWLLAGALLGLALLTKYSAAFLAVALALGLLAAPGRRALASPWPWAGVAVAAALAAPAAWWQWSHGLPFLELIENGRAYKNAPLSAGALAGGVALDQGPFGMALAAAGLVHLLARREGAPGRFLGLAMAGLLLLLPLLGAKPYYLAPVFPPLFAGGAVLAERLLPARRWVRGVALASALPGAVLAAPLAIPLLPVDPFLAWQARLGMAPPRLERLAQSDLPQHFADQLGWPERAAAVAAIWRGLPAADREGAVVYARNYGWAAALELFGRRLGLPPVICGHNQYFLWGVDGDPTTVLAVGGRPQDYAGDFAEVRPVGRTPEVAHAMPYESGLPVYLLRGPARPVAELFRRARHFE